MASESDAFDACSSSPDSAQPSAQLEIEIRMADLNQEDDQAAILEMLNEYAQLPHISGRPLPPEVLDQVIDGLKNHPASLVFLALTGGQTIGMATCFVGFSTFKAQPLINVHDLCVRHEFRGQGVGGKILDAVVQHARDSSYCAVTLEVNADNPARRLYARKGFGVGDFSNESVLFGKVDLTIDPQDGA